MTAKKRTDEGLLKHDMPLMHFWQALGGTLTKQNALLADYAGRRVEDNRETLLSLGRSGDPTAAASTITGYWLRAGSDTTALMMDLVSVPQEISGEFADLVDEETDLMKRNTSGDFDNSPV
jgi:hypothetical protein